MPPVTEQQIKDTIAAYAARHPEYNPDGGGAVPWVLNLEIALLDPQDTANAQTIAQARVGDVKINAVTGLEPDETYISDDVKAQRLEVHQVLFAFDTKELPPKPWDPGPVDGGLTLGSAPEAAAPAADPLPSAPAPAPVAQPVAIAAASVQLPGGHVEVPIPPVIVDALPKGTVVSVDATNPTPVEVSVHVPTGGLVYRLEVAIEHGWDAVLEAVAQSHLAREVNAAIARVKQAL